jgi:hypothetical protein
VEIQKITNLVYPISYGDPSIGIETIDTIKKTYLPSIVNQIAGVSFDSQFNGSAPGWTPLNGTWSIYYDYAYEGSRTGVGWVSTKHDGIYRNFDYSASLWGSGSSSNTSGLIFRGDPSPMTSNQRWKSGYMFGYLLDGRYAVWRFNADGSETALKDWTGSPYITTGSALNTFSVRAQNNNMSFYINGNLVFTASDSMFSSGYVGIVKYTPDGINSKIWVDWATLTTLTSSSLNDSIPQNQYELNTTNTFEGDATGVWLSETNTSELESQAPPKP